MNLITIYAREELTSLETLLRRSYPSIKISSLRTGHRMDSFTIKQKDICRFSKAAAQWMHNRYLKKQSKKILTKMLQDCTEADRREMQARIKDAVDENLDQLLSLLQEPLCHLLSISNQMRIEGFFYFATRSYRTMMDSILDECMESYYSKRDYLEFITFLQTYVETENTLLDEIKIVVQENGTFCFYDERGGDITDYCHQTFLEEFQDRSPEPEDLLVSVLIILLPRKIILYGIDRIRNRNTLQTLKTIFKDRFIAAKEIPENYN